MNDNYPSVGVVTANCVKVKRHNPIRNGDKRSVTIEERFATIIITFQLKTFENESVLF